MVTHLSMMLYFLAGFYSLNSMQADLSFHPIALEWICPQCRHGNPDSATECEYCGKSK